MKMGKKSTKIIIAAAVAVVVIALVLVGIFVVKPAIDNNNETTVPTVSQQNQSGNYEYVDYKGVQMAKELADILEQAEKDSKAASKKYGTVCKIGDWEISDSEFAMHYLDQYNQKLHEVEYAIQQRGSNVTGFDPLKFPTEQKYIQGDTTWADRFASTAISNLQNVYITFDAAIEAGVTLEEHEIDMLIASYERINDYVLNNDTTPDGYVSKVYGSGATYALFARREIVLTYAVKYEEMMAEKYTSELTDEELEKRLAEDPNAYTAIKARIYPIQAEYDAVELSKVSTEEEFLEFAKNNYPQEGYNAETETQCFYVTRDNIVSSFGEAVGNWMFDSKRVQGEVGLVMGELYECLVYIEELPRYINSNDVIYCHKPLFGNETAEQLDELYNQFKEVYDTVAGKSLTPEEFRNTFGNMGDGVEEITAMADDFYFEASNWILDSSRKSGDVEMFADSEAGIYVICYLGENTDDPEWKHYMKTAISNEKYTEHYNSAVNKTKFKEYTDEIAEAAVRANDVVAYVIEKKNEKK